MSDQLIDERELSKLKWRCRRGLLENDLFIERFFKRFELRLTHRQSAALSALMDLGDNDLLDLPPALPACDVTVPATCTSTATNGHTSTRLMFATAQGGTGTQVAENTSYLESVLAAGNDIIFGIYVAGADWSDATIDTGLVDVQLVGGNPAAAYAGHAMLMVGYNRAGNYFEMTPSNHPPSLPHPTACGRLGA